MFSKLVLGSFFLVFIYSCSPERPSSVPLQGHWVLLAAERGGVPTTTLKDAYFSFLGDTLLRTNLLQEDKDYRYTYDGETIEQGGETNISYDILYLNADTMVLKTNISKYDFKFLLIRDSIEYSIPQ